MKQIQCVYIIGFRLDSYMIIYMADDNVFDYMGVRIWI
jgi:hypothetical protein